MGEVDSAFTQEQMQGYQVFMGAGFYLARVTLGPKPDKCKGKSLDFELQPRECISYTELHFSWFLSEIKCMQWCGLIVPLPAQHP